MKIIIASALLCAGFAFCLLSVNNNEKYGNENFKSVFITAALIAVSMLSVSIGTNLLLS